MVSHKLILWSQFVNTTSPPRTIGLLRLLDTIKTQANKEPRIQVSLFSLTLSVQPKTTYVTIFPPDRTDAWWPHKNLSLNYPLSTLSLLTPTELPSYLLIGTVSEEQFMQIIAGLHTYKEPTKKTPLFKFEWSKEAAQLNALILETFEYNIDASIRSQMERQVLYGSEFKPPHLPQELLNHHPHWENLQELLSNGATFPVLPIEKESHFAGSHLLPRSWQPQIIILTPE